MLKLSMPEAAPICRTSLADKEHVATLTRLFAAYMGIRAKGMSRKSKKRRGGESELAKAGGRARGEEKGLKA